MTQYTRANAEALLSVVTAQPNCHWLPIPSEPDSASPSPIYINDEGIFPNVTADDELRWKPCHDLPDGPGALDRAAQPGLPFPFSANELAAWMLNGVGALVAAAFGNLVEREPGENEPKDQPTRLGPDFSVLTDPDANKAREAVQAAFDIYREAVTHVDEEPKLSRTEDVIDRDEMRNEALVKHGLKAPQGTVTQSIGFRAAAAKVKLVRDEVREAYQTAMVRRVGRGPDVQRAEWLSGMVQRLLLTASNSADTHVAGAGGIDTSGLTTADRLINAFGAFTGMNPTWFRKLDDVPALKKARKIEGRGQRNPIPAWYCPYEVVMWLANPGRRKGRPISAEKAWEIYEREFPRSYARYSVQDPR